MGAHVSRRKIIFDSSSRESQMSSVCPKCGAPLSSVKPATLQPVAHNLFRCRPGQHPRAFEARCSGCGRLLIVLKSANGLILASENQDALLKWILDADRADMESVKRRDRGG